MMFNIEPDEIYDIPIALEIFPIRKLPTQLYAT